MVWQLQNCFYPRNYFTKSIVAQGRYLVVNSYRNPYIIGRPIHERHKFFGRESLFNFLNDNLIQDVQVILLHGQRRIGKSSVLQQIPNFLDNNKFVFVKFDLQDKGHSSLSNILYNLALEITERLDIDENRVTLPTNAELENDTDFLFQDFLSKIYQEIDDKKLVLLLDEFDVITNDSKEINIVEIQTFFPYLKKLLKQQKNLFIIPVIGRYLNDLPNLLSLFKDAPYQEIGLLDDISARRMIANPAEGILIYQPEAIQEIMKLSAGHPCYTQVICSTLFEQARENNKWSIERTDVERILNKAIEKSDSFLQGLWDVLSIEERVIMSTVAEAQNIAIEQRRRFPEEPLDLLSKNGINQTEELSQSWKRLIENRYLSDDGRKIIVELIRRWLLKYHPLQNEIQSLRLQPLELQTQENQEYLVKNLIGVANYWSQQGQHQLALQHYEKALEINPNNFNIAVSLAEEYLQVQNFEKSLELYKQLFQADYQSYKEGYLYALSVYGHNLIIQRKYALAKEQYNKILKIEPNTESSIQRVLEIESYENSIISTPELKFYPQYRLLQIRGGLTLVTILAVITAFGIVGYAISLFSSDCPPGQHKEFGFVCVKR